VSMVNDRCALTVVRSASTYTFGTPTQINAVCYLPASASCSSHCANSLLSRLRTHKTQHFLVK
jgi:hypothetical protein